MFSRTITGSARFLTMPVSARLLYYDLGMAADDDGVTEAFTVMRMTGAADDDLRVLAAKGFIRILNEDLVISIADWKRNNAIRKDRYSPSYYHTLLETPSIPQPDDSADDDPMTTDWQPDEDPMTTNGQPDDNQTTTNGQPNGNQTTTNGQPNGNQTTTIGQPNDNQIGQPLVTPGKDRIGEDRTGKGSAGKGTADTHTADSRNIPSMEDVAAYCREISSTVNAAYFHNYYSGKDWCSGRSPITDWKATLRAWDAEDRSRGKHTLPENTPGTAPWDDPLTGLF